MAETILRFGYCLHDLISANAADSGLKGRKAERPYTTHQTIANSCAEQQNTSSKIGLLQASKKVANKYRYAIHVNELHRRKIQSVILTRRPQAPPPLG
jgi:hypothetical protein